VEIKENQVLANSLDQLRIDLERQRIEIEQRKLELELERAANEKAKERTTRMLAIVPAVVSVIALVTPTFTTYITNRMNEMNLVQTRKTELFKRLVEKEQNNDVIFKIYNEVFREEVAWENKQLWMRGH